MLSIGGIVESQSSVDREWEWVIAEAQMVVQGVRVERTRVFGERDR